MSIMGYQGGLRLKLTQTGEVYPHLKTVLPVHRPKFRSHVSSFLTGLVPRWVPLTLVRNISSRRGDPQKEGTGILSELEITRTGLYNFSGRCVSRQVEVFLNKTWLRGQLFVTFLGSQFFIHSVYVSPSGFPFPHYPSSVSVSCPFGPSRPRDRLVSPTSFPKLTPTTRMSHDKSRR